MVVTPYVTLYPTGQKMPQVGLGKWKLDKPLCADTIYKAIQIGYRHFDAACDYGNEVEVGQGLRRAIGDGLIKREDVFVTSKVCATQGNLLILFTSDYATALEYFPCQRACKVYLRETTERLGFGLF